MATWLYYRIFYTSSKKSIQSDTKCGEVSRLRLLSCPVACFFLWSAASNKMVVYEAGEGHLITGELFPRRPTANSLPVLPTKCHSKDLYSATPKYLRPLRSISYFEGTMLCTPNLWGSHVILHGLVNRRLVCSPASGVGHEGPEIPRLCLPFITVIDDLPISVIIL